MKAYLTQRPHLRSMLTRLPPTSVAVGHTKVHDAYVTPGDPFLVSDICLWATDTLIPELHLTPLEPEEVDVHVLSPKHPIDSVWRMLRDMHPDCYKALKVAMAHPQAIQGKEKVGA
jgi:hypothetical protein